jgi:HPt (histidine-containing phosphotransfer) domain-containing protein
MIDEVAFDELRSFGDDFLVQLVGGFTEETEVLLLQLRQSFEEGDTAAVGRIAHNVKGSAGQLGARGLASACGRVERNAITGHRTGSTTDLRTVELEYKRLRLALAERLPPLGALRD